MVLEVLLQMSLLKWEVGSGDHSSSLFLYMFSPQCEWLIVCLCSSFSSSNGGAGVLPFIIALSMPLKNNNFFVCSLFYLYILLEVVKFHLSSKVKMLLPTMFSFEHRATRKKQINPLLNQCMRMHTSARNT